MGRRSRKHRPTGASGEQGRAQATESSPPVAEPGPEGGSDDAMRRGYARGRQRDELIRAGLEPLEAGERPKPIRTAAIIALVFAVANVVAAIAGRDLGGEGADPVAVTAVTTALLVIAAAGMFASRAWAVLGFMVILVLQIVALAGALTLGAISRWWQVLLALALLAGLSYLFWKLIRPLARLQMPSRPAR